MGREHVTVALGVPTVWFGVLDALDDNAGRWKFSWPVRMLVGGAAPSNALMRGFDRHGFKMMCLWGMTQTTPHGSCSQLHPHMDSWSDHAKYAHRLKQGLPAQLGQARVQRPSRTPAATY